jgi:hypothetical protein
MAAHPRPAGPRQTLRGMVASNLPGAPGGLYPHPHHAREEHANAETGWRWYDETSSPHP